MAETDHKDRFNNTMVEASYKKIEIKICQWKGRLLLQISILYFSNFHREIFKCLRSKQILFSLKVITLPFLFKAEGLQQCIQNCMLFCSFVRWSETIWLFSDEYAYKVSNKQMMRYLDYVFIHSDD